MNDLSNGLDLSYLTNLERLTVFYANLQSIDVSNLTQLEWLALGWNSLSSLDVSTLSELEYLNLDRNDLTTLDTSQNTKLEYLNLNRNLLTELDINNNPDLEELIASNNNLTYFSASGLSFLEKLDFTGNNLTGIHLENLPVLNSLTCTNNNLQTVEFENLPALIHLFLSNNELTEISLDNMNLTWLNLENNNLISCQFSNLDDLSTLYLRNNSLPHLALTDLPSLQSLFAGNNELVSVSLSNLPEIKYLDFPNNQLTDLNISDFLQLTDLNLKNNQLSSLTLNNTPWLSYLDLTDNNFVSFTNANLPTSMNHPNGLYLELNNNELLEEIELTDIDNLSYFISYVNPSLTSVNLYGLNKLESLTLTNNPALEEIDLSGLFTDYPFTYVKTNIHLNDNENLKYVFFKTGLDCSESYLNLYNNPGLMYLCLDEFNIPNFVDYYENVEINSYCTFNPGGEYYTISGKNNIDVNQNNDCGDDDSFYPFLKFNFNYEGNDSQIYSNSVGEYTFFHTNEGSPIVITPEPENPAYFSVNPETVTINLPIGENPYLQDFCLTSNGNFNDLEVKLIAIDDARPGFTTNYKMIYRNKGTTELSGDVILNFADDYMQLQTSTPEADSQSSGQLKWFYNNLQPFETGEIMFYMKMNTPTNPDFPLNDGDILNFEAIVTPIDGDESPEDNTFILNQTVINSFDPNDKVCLEGSSISPEMIGEFVHYRIRFENTGTANAINIVVKDIIDTTKFDIQTLTPIIGSHPFETRIVNDNQVEFIFENINLPYQEGNNGGYVLFKIKTLSTLELNDSFSNQADIYFDYNAPITTEEYTTIFELMSTEDFEHQNSSVSIYPNPANDVLNIKSKYKIDKVEILDITHRIIQSKINPAPAINLNGLKSGVYYLKVYSGNTVEVIRFLKK